MLLAEYMQSHEWRASGQEPEYPAAAGWRREPVLNFTGTVSSTQTTLPTLGNYRKETAPIGYCQLPRDGKIHFIKHPTKHPTTTWSVFYYRSY